MKKNINKITIFIFLGLLYTLSILNIFAPKNEISYNENRTLAKAPEFTIENLIEGKYTEELEVYVQDQFVLRDQFIMINAIFNQVLLKLESNNVYIGKDNYLFNQFISYDYDNLKYNIKNLNNFINPFTVILVPNSQTINDNLLSKYAYNINQDEVTDNIAKQLLDHVTLIDVYDSLKEVDDAYFKTDHHWNHLGAYKIYQEYMISKGLKPLEYTFSEVTNDFKGTLYSKSGLFYYPSESLYKINELDDYDISVKFNQEDTIYDSVYFDEQLLKKDKYLYYFKDNFGQVRITNNNSLTDNKLIVVKDSYANILVPYLIPHYDEIIMIDLRHNIDKVSEIMEKEDISEMLFIYSVDQFVNSRELAFLR